MNEAVTHVSRQPTGWKKNVQNGLQEVSPGQLGLLHEETLSQYKTKNKINNKEDDPQRPRLSLSGRAYVSHQVLSSVPAHVQQIISKLPRDLVLTPPLCTEPQRHTPHKREDTKVYVDHDTIFPSYSILDLKTWQSGLVISYLILFAVLPFLCHSYVKCPEFNIILNTKSIIANI